MSESASSITPVLLFTDIVNSTDLQRSLGDARYRRVWDRHNRLFLDACSQARNATVLKNTGDSFLVRFSAPSDGVACALRFQRAMKKADWSDLLREPLSARAGLHLGEVEEVIDPATGRSDVLGYCASIAARVMSLATGGQVLMTRGVFDNARLNLPGETAAYGFDEEERQALRYESWGRYLFKGSIEPDEICEIGIEGFSPLAPPPDSEKAQSIPIDYELRGWRPSEGDQIPHRDGWKLVRMLGEGGFGEAWLARHVPTAELRVFKFCVVAERLQTFRREQALFRHLRQQITTWSGFARLFETHLDTPPYFLEVEYSSLGSLDQWAEGQSGIGSISLEERMHIFARVAFVADQAHKVDVIHCDLKPANILMFPDGLDGVEPRLTDFGIGHLAERSRPLDAGNAMQTLHDDPASRTGTRLYAAPELHADPRLHPTVQRDIYALGVILFQLAVGDFRRPLGPGWESDISDDTLREDIAGAVDVHPERRFATAAELAERIANLSERRDSREAKRKLAEAEATALASRHRFLRTAVACVALLIGLGGAWAWWDYARVKVSYFETYQDRWGVPQGLFAMAEEARRHRFYYRFESSRRRLRKVQIVSSDGRMHDNQLRTDMPATQIVFVYRDDGGLQKRRYLDRYGKLLQTDQISDDGRYITQLDANDRPRRAASQLSLETNFARGSVDPDQVRNLTQIARQEWTYNAIGQLVRFLYRDSDDAPAAEHDGTFGTAYTYDERGDLIEAINLGPDGQPGSDLHGVRIARMAYDDRHQMIEKTFLGANALPIAGEEGYARITYGYDARALCNAEAMYTASGNPAVPSGNFSSVHFDYDDAGFLTRTSYYDPDGKPAMHRNGFFAVLSKYDQLRWKEEINYVDSHEKPAGGQNGVAKTRFICDAVGNDLQEEYFGLQGEPVTSNGVHLVKMTYDERGYRTRREFYGLQGQRVVGKEGFAIEKNSYDERGRALETRFRDSQGRLTYAKFNDQTGAIFKHVYSKDGLRASSAVFGPDEKPSLNEYGFHSMEATYSRLGTVETTELFGTAHEPVVAIWGFHRAVFRHDEHGREVSCAWFDPEGHPAINRQELIHRRDSEYDSRGFVIAQKYLCLDQQLCAGKNGFAEMRLENDEQGRVLSSAYFDPAGKPTVDDSGVAGVRNKYDARGNVSEMTTVSSSGAASESSLGASVWRTQWDDANHATDVAFFDLQGHPTLNASGYHRMLMRYDDLGRVTERQNLGLDGQPILTKTTLADFLQVSAEDKTAYGTAQVYMSLLRFGYDQYGQAVSLKTFGTDGQPLAGLANAHELRVTYNQLGIATSHTFLDAKEHLVLATIGYAKDEVDLDERGAITAMRFIGPDGHGVWRVDPVRGYVAAGGIQERDAFGRLTRAWCLDPDFKRTISNLGFAGVSHRYDAFGKDLEITFLDIEGHPVNSTEGYATERYEYDQYGHESKRSALDASGQPAPIDAGTYTLLLKNNVAGQVVQQLSLDRDGHPITGSEPAYIEFTYNSRGLNTIRRAFDSEHLPMLITQGFSEVRFDYTPAGELLNRRFFGPDGQLIDVPGLGYAEERYRYDNLRRAVEIKFLNARGEPAGGKTGVGRKLQTFTQDASETRCLNVHDQLVNGNLGWARLVTTSSAPGALDRLNAFDAEGNHLVAALAVGSVQPDGTGHKMGLQVGDIILRAGAWNCLTNNGFSYERRVFEFTSLRLTQSGSLPGIVVRDGQLLSLTFPPGLLSITLDDRYLPEAVIKKTLEASTLGEGRK